MAYLGATTRDEGLGSILETLLLLMLLIVVMAILVDDWIIHLPISLRSIIGYG